MKCFEITMNKRYLTMKDKTPFFCFYCHDVIIGEYIYTKIENIVRQNKCFDV